MARDPSPGYRPKESARLRAARRRAGLRAAAESRRLQEEADRKRAEAAERLRRTKRGRELEAEAERARSAAASRAAQDRVSRAYQEKMSTARGKASAGGAEIARQKEKARTHYERVRDKPDPFSPLVREAAESVRMLASGDFRGYRERSNPPRMVARPTAGGAWSLGPPTFEETLGRSAQMEFPGFGPVGRFASSVRASRVPAIEEQIARDALTRAPRLPSGRRMAPRTVRYKDRVVQFPSSPSWVTAQGQRMLDRASERLADSVDRMREGGVVSRAVGTALTPASARGRVTKQAGKLRRQEQRRHRAEVALEARRVRKVGRTLIPGRSTSPEGAANWWYAQLPPEYRNAQGLTAVRNMLDDELQRLIKADAPLDVDIKDLGTAINKLDELIQKPPPVDDAVMDALRVLDEDRTEILTAAGVLQPEFASGRRWLLSRHLGLVKPNFTGVRGRLGEAVTAAHREAVTPYLNKHKARSAEAAAKRRLKQLEKRQERGEFAHDDEIAQLDAMLELEAAQAFRAGNTDLSLELNAMREALHTDPQFSSIIDEVLGGERPIYMGHRVKEVARQNQGGQRLAISIGKSAAPQGAKQRNRMRLVRSGRVRQELKVALEDWQAAQTYAFHNAAKDELGRLGDPLDVATFNPKTDIIVNQQGHNLPRSLTMDDEARALAEGFSPEMVVDDAYEYVTNYLAEGAAAAERMITLAQKYKHLDKLRVVKKDVARRYFSQFVRLDPRGRSAIPAVDDATRSLIGQGADVVNDALYISLIYSNPGFIPSQWAGNSLLVAMQQGVYAPQNMARAGQLLAAGPERLRDKVLAEVWTGATRSIASDTSPLHHVGGALSPITDEPFRVSAFLHEASAAGVIKRVQRGVKPLTDDDYRKLDDLFKPENRALLNDISDRANQAMIDFNRLGATERAFARRMLFVWAFMRGAMRYPIRFSLDHPVRVAAGAGAAYAYKDELQGRFKEGMPPYLRGTLKVGDKALPTGSYNPLDVAIDMGGTVTGKEWAETFFGITNPGFQALVHAADKKSPWGGEVDSYRESLKQNAERLLPQPMLARDLINPPEDKDTGMYPEDATRTGRMKRALRLIPIEIDEAEAKKARDRAYGGGAKGAEGEYRDRLNELVRDARKAQKARPQARLLRGGKLPKEVQDALLFDRKVDREVERRKKDLGVEKLTDKQVVLVAARILVSHDKSKQEGVARLIEDAESAVIDWQRARSILFEHMMKPAERYRAAVNRILREQALRSRRSS